jgi:hypothetical protein
MSKITIAILTLAAFLYAAWLVFLRKPLPDPKGATGLRKRFLFAVLLFAGLLGASAGADDGKTPQIMCYSPAVLDPNPVKTTREDAMTTLKAVWRTLDPEKGEEFRRRLDAAVKQGNLRQKVAGMLQVAFRDLSFHKARTRTEGQHVTCYSMTMLGGTLMTSRENAYKQLELLDGARKKGTIDAETAERAYEALAREIEVIHRGEEIHSGRPGQDENDLVKQYQAGEIVPSREAKDAAGIIVEMEGGSLQEPDKKEEE